MRRIVTPLTAAVAAGLLLTACTPSPGPADPTVTPTAAATGASSTAAPSDTASPVPADPYLSYIARVDAPSLTVYEAPGGAELMTVAAADVLTVPDQTPFVFLVQEVEGDWLELNLPVRPNGTTGWVERDQVDLTSTRKRIEVSLADFELTVYDGEDAILTTSIGLGQDELPTPGGTYYIRELLQPPDPTTVYGPYAYGLSGYSPVLDSFKGGDAVIGIHGNNDPSSIGRAVSSGCIRLPNDAIRTLVEQVGLPLGTPVHIAEGAAGGGNGGNA